MRVAALLLIVCWGVGCSAPARPEAARQEPGNVLVISDIHFDPFYDRALFGELETEPAERWAGVLNRSQPPGVNPREQDSNYALFASALDDAKARVPDPALVLCPGDFLAHDWSERYDALAAKSHLEAPVAFEVFNRKVVRFVASEFRARFGKRSIVATLGNNDSDCGDYRVTPGGPFLKMFAEEWGELIVDDAARADFEANFARLGCFSIRVPYAAKTRVLVMNSVYLSANYENACGDAAQAPAREQLSWLERELDRASEARERVWLLLHIPPGIDCYYTARDMAQGLPPVSLWSEQSTDGFLKIMGSHVATVVLGFAGHTHRDDFRVVRDDARALLALKITPAISPIYSNNPGYQVFQFDRSNGAVINYRTYYLANLDVASRGEGGPRWELEYDFARAYGAAAVDVASFEVLHARINDGTADQRLYEQFYGVGVAPEITPAFFDVYRCAMQNVTVAEFLRCHSKKAPAAAERAPVK